MTGRNDTQSNLTATTPSTHRGSRQLVCKIPVATNGSRAPAPTRARPRLPLQQQLLRQLTPPPSPLPQRPPPRPCQPLRGLQDHPPCKPRHPLLTAASAGLALLSRRRKSPASLDSQARAPFQRLGLEDPPPRPLPLQSDGAQSPPRSAQASHADSRSHTAASSRPHSAPRWLHPPVPGPLMGAGVQAVLLDPKRPLFPPPPLPALSRQPPQPLSRQHHPDPRRPSPGRRAPCTSSLASVPGTPAEASSPSPFTRRESRSERPESA